MANTNIAYVQLVNTFNEWRAGTNDLIQDRNTLRNAHYVKDNGAFTMANGDLTVQNGAVTISRSSNGTVLTVANSGNVYIGGWVNVDSVFANTEIWVGPRILANGSNVDRASRIQMGYGELGTVQDGNASWYSANQRSNNPYYGFTSYSNGQLILTNEESVLCQAIVLGDSAYRPSDNVDRIGTIFGVSTLVQSPSSPPSTGLESGWEPVIDVRSNAVFIMPIASGSTGNTLYYNVSTGEITYSTAPTGGAANVLAGEYILENTTVNAANTVQLNVASWFKYTLTGSSGNRQMTFTNAPASGNSYTFSMIMIQDGSGGKTPTWANTIYWAGGQVPPATTNASARDIWSFTTYDGGSTYIGTLAVKDAR